MLTEPEEVHEVPGFCAIEECDQLPDFSVKIDNRA